MKLIAIESAYIDGKTELINKVISGLRKKYRLINVHFPRAEFKEIAIIQKYLKNELELSAFDAAKYFANDRHDFMDDFDSLNKAYDLLVVDGYVLSNALHQCGVEHFNENKKKHTQTLKLCEKIFNFEYVLNKIPIPDLTVFISNNAISVEPKSQDKIERDFNIQEFVNLNHKAFLTKHKSQFGAYEIVDASMLAVGELVCELIEVIDCNI